jgi:hypothetical protein
VKTPDWHGLAKFDTSWLLPMLVYISAPQLRDGNTYLFRTKDIVFQPQSSSVNTVSSRATLALSCPAGKVNRCIDTDMLMVGREDSEWRKKGQSP